MRIAKFLVYILISPFFKIRHHFFEIYHRSVFVKRLKKFLKNFIPTFIFNYFKKKKLENLVKFPESFYIETVNICNAKCWFCARPDHVRKNGYMHFDIYKKILDEIHLHRNKVKSIALFMDGDPTLHKEKIKFLIYEKKKKIKNINFSSNIEFFWEE